MKEDVKIVTAFVNLDRGNWIGSKNGQEIPPYIQRSNDVYLERFKRMTKLKNEIILFCEDSYRRVIQDYVENAPNVTYVSIDPFMDVELIIRAISQTQKNIDFISFVTRKSAPEYWNAEYVYINFLKSFLVSTAVERGMIDEEDMAAWLDFGYCREDKDAPEGKTFKFETSDEINLWINGDISPLDLSLRPIFEIVRTGDVYVQGCHIVAKAKLFLKLYELIGDSLDRLLSIGLIDDDQTMLLMALRKESQHFNFNKNSSQDWFNVIRNNCE